MTLRQLLRKLGVGRALYRLKKTSQDGFVYTVKYWWADRRMQAAARRLRPPTGEFLENKAPVVFLTGRSFWHQTAFCIRSLQDVCEGRPLRRIVVIDDGTLGGDQAELLARISPGLKIIWSDDMSRRFSETLTEDRFPALNQFRRTQPHARKLIDVALAVPEPSVLLDSDMLFRHTPDEILHWIMQPSVAFFMEDRTHHYGFPVEQFESFAGVLPSAPVNCGVIGLDRSQISWLALERITAQIIAQYGITYFTEQGLQAVLMAQAKAFALPKKRYIVRPEGGELVQPTGALHHYTWTSRLNYLQVQWRRFAK